MPGLQTAVESDSQRGLALCKQAHFEQAIDCFRRALLDHPACADTHNNLGVALMERGLHADAVGSFVELAREARQLARQRKSLKLRVNEACGWQIPG